MPEDNKRTSKDAKVTLEKKYLKALLKYDEDFFKRKEYEIHFVVPYDEDGGEVRGVIENFMAESSAEAVRYVSDLYDFPEMDDDEIDGTKYGIIKVRKVSNDKIFTGEELLKSWQFIFDNYTREVNIDGARIKSNDNREEILMSLINYFKLPRYNKLTDKYNMPNFNKGSKRKKY